MRIITQLEAARQGLNKYYTGKLCKKGHKSERWTISGECVQCNVERVYRRRREISELLKAAQEVI
ncbi:hypothetical protein [Pantoea ananatis]|jgi:hypothetical protein|uniref:hypothetical protein n=1 Tax=Pantoea ananas TaxID=553 RepID=UPI001B300606|nr:hypothetical protein [Pantoea ananatis]